MKAVALTVALLAAALVVPGGPARAERVVTTTILKLYAGPGTNYRALSIIPGGTVLNAGGSRSGWRAVNWQNMSGWVNGRYLRQNRSNGNWGFSRDPKARSDGYLLGPNFLFERRNGRGGRMGGGRMGSGPM